MKEILLSLITVPGFLIVIYIFGLGTSGYKKKLKYFSSALLMMFIVSLPIFSKIFSYPLIGLPKLLIQNNLKDVKAIVVLTGGIYQNILNEWQPSNTTEKRILHAKKVLNKKNIPLIISGGVTKLNAPSEARLSKEFYKLDNAKVETNSLNTYQSAKNLKSYCKMFDKKLLIITDMFHSLRSYLSFKSQGCKTILYNYDYSIKYRDLVPSLYGFAFFNKTIYEYVAIFYYIATFKINLIAII